MKTKNIKLLRNQIKSISVENNIEDKNYVCYSEILKNLSNNNYLDHNLKGLGCDNKDGMCYYYNNKYKGIYQYLPIPLPKKKVNIFLICKEPSIGWAENQNDAKSKVHNSGYQNFIACDLFDLKPNEINKINKSIKKNRNIIIEKPIKGVNVIFTALLSAYYAKYNYKPSVYITDLSKCAMDVKEADNMVIYKEGNKVITKEKKTQKQLPLLHRYGCCSNFLKWEIENISLLENTQFIFVGKTSYFAIQNKSKEKYQLLLKNFLKGINEKIDTNKVTHIPHYALQNVPISLLDLFYDSDEDIIKAKDEIKDIFLNLDIYKYYSTNFYFSDENEKALKRSIDNLSKYKNEINIRVSNISLILYAIYKKHFEKIL